MPPGKAPTRTGLHKLPGVVVLDAKDFFHRRRHEIGGIITRGRRHLLVTHRHRRPVVFARLRRENAAFAGTVAMSALLVLTNCPDDGVAEAIASALVNARLAACVNILPPARSVYRWQGKVESADEVPLLIKTTRERYAAVEVEIRSLHPYEVPEIIAIPIDHGLPAYLQWVRDETQPD